MTGAAPPVEMPKRGTRREAKTAISPERFRELHQAIHDLPEGFKPSSKLLRIFDARRAFLESETPKLDWAHAESMAFGRGMVSTVVILLPSGRRRSVTTASIDSALGRTHRQGFWSSVHAP